MASPGGASSPRAKRVRTIFSAEQLERLEAEFARQQYMVGPERLILAASLRLSESQVRYHLISGPFQSINLQLITVDHFNGLFQTELIRNQLRLQLNSIVFFCFFLKMLGQGVVPEPEDQVEEAALGGPANATCVVAAARARRRYGNR